MSLQTSSNSLSKFFKLSESIYFNKYYISYKKFSRAENLWDLISFTSKIILVEDVKNLIFFASNNIIRKIRFSNKFNRSVDNLPQSVESITFGDDFNQSVDNLPHKINNLFVGVESITFGYRFNQSVDKLPQSVKSITFGSDFNQSVDKLPESSTYRMY